MDAALQGTTPLAERVESALDRLGELRAGPRVQSDARFSQSFIADHTEFDSYVRFCEQSPWDLDRRDAEDVPRERLNEYVAAHTDFETWEELRTLAAEEEIIDQVVF